MRFFDSFFRNPIQDETQLSELDLLLWDDVEASTVVFHGLRCFLMHIEFDMFTCFVWFENCKKYLYILYKTSFFWKCSSHFAFEWADSL